jgi:RNA polymerase sigma-70 factor (ECF subfamily)
MKHEGQLSDEVNVISREDFDSFLLQRLREGDQDAFRQIFTRWEKPLFHFVANITGSASHAEDICQETFCTLWLKRESIDRTKNIKTYIFLIAKQRAWKLLRSRKRHGQTLPIEHWDSDADAAFSPDNIIQLRETELLAQYAISKLPQRTREIYEMHLVDDLSYDEIATILGTNPLNVKTQIYKARRRMREIIAMAIVVLMAQ